MGRSIEVDDEPVQIDGASGRIAAQTCSTETEPGLVTARQDYLVNPGGLRKVAGVHKADPARTWNSDAH